MTYKNKEKRKEEEEKSKKKYLKNNREKVRLNAIASYHKRMEDPEYRKKEKIRSAKRELALKIEVFTHYSNGVKPFCKCCNESTIEFLTMDHINNNGTEDRKKGLSGSVMYRYAKKHNYPKDLQVLCHNCNQARGHEKDKICPHKK